MSAILLSALLTAFVTSLGVAFLIMRARVLDMPGQRSLHAEPTPRGGGLGVVAAAGAAFLLASFQPLPLEGGAALLAFVIVMAALGLCDDLFALPARVKFAVMALACLGFAALAGKPEWIGVSADLSITLPVWIALPGAALFLFVAVNASNFMDGSDGMLAAVLIPAGAGLAVAGLVVSAMPAVFAGLALAGGLGGFLVLNRPPAKVFAGDAGSLGAGALYAGGALMMAGEDFAGSLWLGPLFILPFLTDVLLTLAKRARGGRLSLNAHREHAYQLLVSSGWSHGRVALVYAALTSLCVIAGLIAAQGPDGAVFGVFWCAVAVLSGLYALAHRRAR